jgi:sulfur carrier protein ThiS
MKLSFLKKVSKKVSKGFAFLNVFSIKIIMVKVRIVHENIEKEIDYKGQLKGIAEKLGYSPQEVIFKIKGKIKPDNYSIKGNEEVELIKVVFGG